MARRTRWYTGLGILLAAVMAVGLFRPDRAAHVAAGLTAHNLCSATFVSGLDPAATFNEQIRTLVGDPALHLLHYKIDRDAGVVRATFAGLAHASARFAPGYGCRLEYRDNLPAPRPVVDSPKPVPDGFAPPDPVPAADATIAAALDRVFAEHPPHPTKDVKAVVVVKHGVVVAERYAPGFGPDTPLLSYSVAKSFTNALLGVLVRQGRLRVDQPAAAPEWAGAADLRQITIEHLLRMASGLDVAEAESAFSPVARMEYIWADMAGFAARHPLKQPPGTAFEYTSANTLILDRLIGLTVGGGPEGLRAFAERELFAPLHMTGVTMEFDGAGVFIGSSYVFAPARAYARFGALYQRDGVASDGQRILPEGWVAWSRRSTLGAPYGAGFWTVDGPAPLAARWVRNGFPKDGFFASGDLGQRIYIVPSADLVVARFGYSAPPDFGIDDDIALIAAAIRATREAKAAVP